MINLKYVMILNIKTTNFSIINAVNLLSKEKIIK